MNAVVQPSQDAPTGAPPAPKLNKPRPAAIRTAAAAAETVSTVAVAQKANASAPPRKPPKGIAGFDIPDGAYRESLEVTLRSLEVVKLADVGFAHAHESFYNIEFVLPHYQNENIERIKETELSMSALVGALASDLANDLKRMRQKAKEKGVSLSGGGYVPKTVDVPVSSKYAVMLLNILKDLDELYYITNSLTFNSAMLNAERVAITSQWRNRVKRFIRSLKHTYVMLKARGDLPTDAGDRPVATVEQLQDELDDLDDAASGDAGQADQAAV
ncbi:hypothetical protein ACCQ07_21530 (plasmid) [Xanthomonas sp. NCPPB 3583]|uniref:hypothetical protein n=1 Tax=Xanthomonas sp. NCPPB 3583 TaxID=487558 RepID=UPI0035577681